MLLASSATQLKSEHESGHHPTPTEEGQCCTQGTQLLIRDKRTELPLGWGRQVRSVKSSCTEEAASVPGRCRMTNRMWCVSPYEFLHKSQTKHSEQSAARGVAKSDPVSQGSCLSVLPQLRLGVGKTIISLLLHQVL